MSKPMKKFVAIAPSSALRHFLPHVEKAGFGHYTVIDAVAGQGDRGPRRAESLHGGESNILFLCVCDAVQLQALVAVIKPHLDRFGGICWASDVECL